MAVATTTRPRPTRARRNERWAARVRRAADELATVLYELEPERCDADAAMVLLDVFTRARKAAAAGEALVARRVDECGIHRQSGHRSTAHLLAEAAGTTVAHAASVVDTGKRLRDLPATDHALRTGSVSVEQAQAVAAGASADPSAETELLAFAGRESVRRLSDRARDLRLAAADDRLGRYRRQHAARSLRHGRDDDGMVWGRFALPPDLGAAVIERLERQADHEFRAARGEGRREGHDRYLADALVALTTGAKARSDDRRADVVVHVSRDALLRDQVGRGDYCMIQGAGPVPVEVARRYLDDAFLKGVLVDGADVTKVRHFGRRRPAELRTALEVRTVLADGDVICSHDSCDQRLGLEWHHEHAHADGGPTSYDNLVPLCRHHHRQKTAGGVSPDGRDPP